MVARWALLPVVPLAALPAPLVVLRVVPVPVVVSNDSPRWKT